MNNIWIVPFDCFKWSATLNCLTIEKTKLMVTRSIIMYLRQEKTLSIKQHESGRWKQMKRKIKVKKWLISALLLPQEFPRWTRGSYFTCWPHPDFHTLTCCPCDQIDWHENKDNRLDKKTKMKHVLNNQFININWKPNLPKLQISCVHCRTGRVVFFCFVFYRTLL